jgi:hypothetical protein
VDVKRLLRAPPQTDIGASTTVSERQQAPDRRSLLS